MLNRLIPALIVSLLGFSAPAVGNPNEFNFSIGGVSKTCTSYRGEPVKIKSNTGLQSLGRAFRAADGSPVIELHPGAMNAYSPQVQAWWFAHECAHLQLSPTGNSENRADCVAAKSMKQELRLNGAQSAAIFQKELHGLSASAMGHSAGSDRANTVIKCAGLVRTV